MAYQAFYNKYRPQTFEEVVGQKAVVTTLKNAIKDNKIAHAYLFCGPRGTGKTTMARLFAKALNCKEGLGHQCNECDSCLSIMKGEHPDVIEIDAASNSTVDSVRQLIDNVSYQPIMSDYKVYIIDEVHNMSNSAFNALLKTLEEPPSFVIFILATTEPQKLLPTILSRVQRFDFSKVSEKDLINNMKRVLEGEHISYQEEALRLVASLSDGGVRDSLSLLDKLVSYCGDNLTVEDVDEMLGLLSLSDELNLINMISARKTEECLKLVKEKYESGMDINRLHNDLIDIYKDYIIYSSTRNPELMDRLKENEVRALDLTFDSARTNIDLLIQAKRDNRYADDLFSHFQLTLINMMSDKPVEKQTSKKEEKKEEESALVTAQVEVKGSSETKAFVAEAKTELVKDSDEILYTKDDILSIMAMAKTDMRKEIASSWNKLQDYFVSENSYEAKALFTSRPIASSDKILIVTNKSIAEVEKINKKKSQAILQKIVSEITGKKVSVLPMREDIFMDYYQEFKKNKPTTPVVNIDFGVKEEKNAADDFISDIFGGN